ncbi:MAG: glycoside hydrolase family 172 protein [Fimbriimonadales bacterium]
MGRATKVAGCTLVSRGFVAFWFVGAALTCSAQVTIRSLLLEMDDLSRLSRLPNPPYTTAQSSSFDRASKSPLQDWFANADYGKFLRSERSIGRTEYVMADLKGPGAVVRIWSANPQGYLRIYVDGKELPELVTPFADLTKTQHPDFPAPFSGMHSHGCNLYYPIPYEKSLKITLDDNGGEPARVYYHVNYRTYPANTPVVSFSMAGVKDAAKVAERIGKSLTDPKVAPHYRDEVISDERVLAPGELFSVRTPSRAGAIKQLSVRIAAADGEELPESVYRMVKLDADFDGESCISSPVGDFFGTSPGLRAFQSLPISVVEATGFMISRWVMPQKAEGRIFFTNRSESEIRVNVEIVWEPRNWTENSLYFKAKWRRETLATRPFRDWNFLTSTGTGRYVGAAMYIANPTSAWWGEGDEKIYVDGEEFPSTFGTGTEDYFGYAWSSNELFQHTYHNQVRCDGPGTRGYTAINRFQVIDDIPFTKQFKFDMEIWHWADVKADFAEVSYWYQKPGGSDGFAPITSEMQTVFTLPEPLRVKGAIEGESLKLISKSGGELEKQELDERWSNSQQVWWRDAKPGDKASWEVPSSATGKLRLRANCCVAADYGLVQLYWNGEKLGSPIDFYSATLNVRLIDFGEVQVSQVNRLEAEIVGANDSAIKRHMFAIDYLLIGNQN